MAIREGRTDISNDAKRRDDEEKGCDGNGLVAMFHFFARQSIVGA